VKRYKGERGVDVVVVVERGLVKHTGETVEFDIGLSTVSEEVRIGRVKSDGLGVEIDG
jgi:hypothetical protein